MGDFVKYYDGSFCESGIFDRESMIQEDSWHLRAVYSEPGKTAAGTGNPGADEFPF